MTSLRNKYITKKKKKSKLCCSPNWFKSLLLPQRKGTPYSNMTPAVFFIEQPQHTILAKHTSGLSIILTLLMLVCNNREMRKGTAGWEALFSSKQHISSTHAMLCNLAIKTSWKNLETTLVSPGIQDICDASQDLVRNQVLKSNFKFKAVPGKQMPTCNRRWSWTSYFEYTAQMSYPSWSVIPPTKL